MQVLRLILESFRFAWNALKMNLLRTTLSLLGVTIGIFAIISVFTIVDSLEKNVKQSFDFLGSGVIYVAKWPFTADSNGEYRWWDFWQRPNPSYQEFKFLEANLDNRSAIAIYADMGNVVVKRNSNSYYETELTGGSYGYKDIIELDIDKGRYFTQNEIASGRNVAIIGHELEKALFPNGENPVGKEVKIRNKKHYVIGTLKREGESFLGFESKDSYCIIPYDAFRTMYTTGTGNYNERGSTIAIKGMETDIGLVELEGELTGMLRTRRGLRPKEEDNFALNRPEAIANVISGVFDVFGIAGWIIGGFSILVGGFGIANIMFVSVKERTNIIGIQKSLGAKNYFILFQFLFESVFLSVIGGLGGLVLVLLITFIPMGSLEVSLTLKNIVLGLGVSAIIGTVSGIVPAALAARLDPVIAIRS
ncbi:ABC transporter permease [Fulvivirga lutea]|uniref:ABC transporter permease n=1 Tax=Fulvivirga lutea TaxID=2810512 RepID=A0A974WFE0_9BACT|nr:ABC transporter permease [Fulvivirga lutea]QSE97201.1 ABC transporter permease [Fulvivirga lutea]